MATIGQPIWGGAIWGQPGNIDVRAISKASILPYLRRYLNDPNKVIWTDTYLLGLINQAETYLAEYVDGPWYRFSIPTIIGQALYGMSLLIKKWTRITYRSYKVDPLTQPQVAMLSPVYRTQISRPRWWTLQYEGFAQLRFYPVPYENLPNYTTNLYNDTNLLTSCIASAFFYPDETNPNFVYPDYLIRRTVKLYVLWKCFIVEGDGQDLQAGQYFKKRLDEAIASCKRIMGLVYSSCERQYSDVAIQRPYRKAHPILPPNFGTPVQF